MSSIHNSHISFASIKQNSTHIITQYSWRIIKIIPIDFDEYPNCANTFDFCTPGYIIIPPYRQKVQMFIDGIHHNYYLWVILRNSIKLLGIFCIYDGMSIKTCTLCFSSPSCIFSALVMSYDEQQWVVHPHYVLYFDLSEVCLTSFLILHVEAA